VDEQPVLGHGQQPEEVVRVDAQLGGDVVEDDVRPPGDRIERGLRQTTHARRRIGNEHVTELAA
jgi:hypothetical protein